jgi:hypothetical protein
MGTADQLLVATRGQLAGDSVHLRRLRTSLQRASIVIRQATIAYTESRKLLERIDGAPNAPLLSEIHIPD